LETSEAGKVRSLERPKHARISSDTFLKETNASFVDKSTTSTFLKPAIVESRVPEKTLLRLRLHLNTETRISIWRGKSWKCKASSSKARAKTDGAKDGSRIDLETERTD